MNWTSEYPTQPGYYWIKNYVLKTWRGDEVTPGSEVVQVDSEGDFRHTSHDSTTFKNWVVSAEWCGPITPPEQENVH